MRLIDADALTDSLDNLCNTVCQYSKAQRSVMCGACPLGGAFDVVDDAPTVEPIRVGDVCKDCWRDGGNVVEVVRCEDCKHWDGVPADEKTQDHECHLFDGNKENIRIATPSYWFCPMGERRTDDVQKTD